MFSIYTISLEELTELKIQVDKDLRREFIKFLKNSAEYPVIFILKKDSKKRLYINYSHLNLIIKKNISFNKILKFQALKYNT